MMLQVVAKTGIEESPEAVVQRGLIGAQPPWLDHPQYIGFGLAGRVAERA